MKILLTVHQFLPDFGAGTEVLTLSVARELISRGHELIVFSGHPIKTLLTGKWYIDEYTYLGVHVYRIHHGALSINDNSSRMKEEYSNSIATKHFKHLLQSFKPDVVHFFHFARLGTALVDEAIDMGVPAFFTPTDFWSICPNARLAYADGTPCRGPSLGAANCATHLAGQKLGPTSEKLLSYIPNSISEAIAGLARTELFPAITLRDNLHAIKERLPTNIARLKKLNHIVAPNKMIESSLTQHGIPASKITVSEYGIDLGINRRIQPRVRGSELRIGFIGTLSRHKGCHTLIDAFNTLKKGLATLEIYGSETHSPSYSKKLRAKAKNNSSISFNGTFPNNEISTIFSGLDILVVPSIWSENTPLVIYSAHAFGCPVVASNVPGIVESIRPETDGLLFEQGNHLDLASCLQRLIHEPNLITELSANARTPRSTPEYVNHLLEIWDKR